LRNWGCSEPRSYEVFIHLAYSLLPKVLVTPQGATNLPIYPDLFRVCSGSLSQKRFFHRTLSERYAHYAMSALWYRGIRSGSRKRNSKREVLPKADDEILFSG